MNILVDTSVWSLALRRDTPNPDAVTTLTRCIHRGDLLFTTGIMVQELLQGFRGPKQREHLVERFSNFPVIVPDLSDHVAAAALQRTCRRKGIQIQTVDALLAQLAIGHDLDLLTTDRDFDLIARHFPLRMVRVTD